MEPDKPQERLERLKKSARLVSDIKNLNAVLEPVPAVTYPQFSHEIKLFCDGLVSAADVVSAFMACKYDEESIKLTQFTLNG